MQLSVSSVKSTALVHVDLPTMSTTRDQARAQTTADILHSARAQLAEVGPAGLSLRAVARDIGMVSSAVYRYVASRDELLTALIVQCYDELGQAVELAEAPCGRQDFRGRWRAVCQSIRRWALQHPHEYALLYGSPVPGYAAPETTIGPATRPTIVLVRIVIDAHADSPSAHSPLSKQQSANLAGARDFVIDDFRERHGRDPLGAVDDEFVIRTLSAWTHVFGAVSFEMFGHLVGSITDYELFFNDIIERMADTLQLGT